MGISRRILGVGMTASVAVAGWVAVAGATPGAVIGVGPDWRNPAVANPLAAAEVTIYGAVTGDGVNQLTLEVEGITAEPGTVLGAHLHESPCGSTATSSGPHYSESGEPGPLRQRELWLDLHVDGNGRARATATRHWTIDDRPDRSVVIHAAATDHESGVAGTRLACTDLDA